jgi:hypothetical protein
MGRRISNHQAFADLLSQWEAAGSNEAMLDMSAAFTATAKTVSENLKLLRGPRAFRHQIRISNVTLRLINKRRRLALRLSKQRAVSPSDRDELDRLRKAVAAALKVEREERWMLFITRGCKLAVLGRSRQYWKWLNRLRGPGTNDAVSMTVLHDSNGVLQTSPDAVLEVWEEYFRTLASDETGHSLDAGYWEAKFQNLPMS